MSDLPAEDDGYEVSFQAARRSCSALFGLLGFFWLTWLALLIVPGTPREQPLLVGLMVAVGLSVVTAAPFVREWMIRRTIGEHLETPFEKRRPRHVYAAFANATAVAFLVAQAPALCGFVSTVMTRYFLWMALGSLVTVGVWIGLWPRRSLWDRWTWQAKLRREGVGMGIDDGAPASKAKTGPPAA